MNGTRTRTRQLHQTQIHHMLLLIFICLLCLRSRTKHEVRPRRGARKFTTESDVSEAQLRACERCQGQNTADVTSAMWPVSVMMHSPVVAFQILAVRSHDDVTTNAPSEENAAEVNEPLFPVSVRRHFPEVALQILAVPSYDDVTTAAPSGENAAE